MNTSQLARHSYAERSDIFFAVSSTLLIVFVAVLVVWSDRAPSTSVLDTTPPPHASTTLLSIDSVPQAASVWVDGVYQGRTPLRSLLLDARRGGVLVELERAGYQPLRRRVAWNDDAGHAVARFALEEREASH